MKRIAAITAAAAALLTGCAHGQPAAAPVVAPRADTTTAATPAATEIRTWQRHDPSRPQPRIARPAAAGALRPPADATTLFDGNNLDAWHDEHGGNARWAIREGTLEVVTGAGSIQTVRPFGSVQLHIEWLSPLPPQGEDAVRGNSGVVFMGKYEVQILDSYGSGAPADAQAGAIYGQAPPLVNASLPPGEWQSFDIVFHAPRFENGRLLQRARITVFQNGVLVQDNVEIGGPTSDEEAGSSNVHPSQLPLVLQNGGQPVRFRNIWIRDLNEVE